MFKLQPLCQHSQIENFVSEKLPIHKLGSEVHCLPVVDTTVALDLDSKVELAQNMPLVLCILRVYISE